MTDSRQYAPATQRNRDPILEVLQTALPQSGLVLEIASGSGEHVVHFARALPRLTFQPSDPDTAALASIAGWIAATGLANVRPPIRLDATALPWPVAAADAVLCINMVHISPWSATEALIRGAAAVLAPGAPLYLYGPYLRREVETAPSNLAFDQSLRARNPAWGVRQLETLTALARSAGFAEPIVTAMPANNLSLVFRREQS
jgi:SAM-dependent methyltransferase